MPLRLLLVPVISGCCCFGLATRLPAQQAAPAVGLGFGVDTSARDVGAIVRLVRAYLAHPDSTAHTRGLWSAASAFDRTHGDVAAPLAYQGFPATIASVVAASAAPADTLYVVTLLHARSAEHPDSPASPLALERLYARRVSDDGAAPYGWQLANALPYRTRGWHTVSRGTLTFHYAPGQPVRPARAAAAARFVDSVAAQFGVRAPARLDYYVVASPTTAYQAIGLDFFAGVESGPGSDRGAVTLAGKGLLFVGDPIQGEFHRHELVHAAIGGRYFGEAPLLNEGAAAWLGGALGYAPGELYAQLATYQQQHPEATLRGLLEEETPAGEDARTTTLLLYASGALVCDAVYRRGGVAALRALAGSPGNPDALIAALRRALGLPDSDATALEAWWRTAPARSRRAGT